ncbi:ankyrin repeat-containing domain protein [Xylaria sp. FL1777]|nr:ankyrin repeat-containing domain protein [Xylaria sp. FL1777]
MTSNDWELHKDTILCLFLLEKLSLQDTSVRMKEEYNFDRNKHQYQYQLKKWGIKKNSRRDVWRYVGHKIQKRKVLGKMSEITLYGVSLPPDKVRKEVQRYKVIPTAKDFADGVPSPANPGWDIVRVVTPSPSELQQQWPATLPWLMFLEGARIDLLQVPNMARLLATTRTISHSQAAAKNPLTMYAQINNLFRSMPHNRESDDQNGQSSLWAGGPSEVAIELLKVILFSLANKNLNNLDVFGISYQERDEFILWLIACILENNFQWLIHRIGTGCSTSNSISEVVYGCAIRQRRYSLVSRLLEAGVDPNMPVSQIHVFNTEYFVLERERSAISPEEDNALEFVQLFMGYGVQSGLLPPLGIAIARHHNRLAKFLIDKLLQTTFSESVISYNVGVSQASDEGGSYWRGSGFSLLQIDCTLLHIAIASENTEMVDFLLSTTLACTDLVSKKALKDLFVVACLAGDRRTIEQLVLLNVDWSGGDWTHVSPLTATAWNPDIEIAEMILQSGAFSSHDIGDFPQKSTRPLPIHVAACAGNTNFVRWLADYNEGLDVQFSPPKNSQWTWLVPSFLATPLQMALQSGNVATAVQCLHAKLLGGELIQAVRLGDEGVLSDLLLRDKNITFTSANNDNVLDAAVEVGNRDIISLYFSSGGKYRSITLWNAVQTALISQDYSIVSLLATNRPFGLIDRNEASALVRAIRERQLGLVYILLRDQFIPHSTPSFPYRKISDKGEIPDQFSSYLSITPLYAAFAFGDTNLTKKLLQVGYRARPRDLKCYSLYGGNLATASLFLSQFSPSDDNQEWTRCLLFESVHLNMAQKVRECIACIDSLNYYARTMYRRRVTPLQAAVSLGNTNLTFLLIDSGADINTPAAPEFGATALQMAAIHGFISIARLLLERGGDVNAPPAKFSGRTALEGASEHGHLDLVKLLLERGAELDGAMRIHYIRAIAYAKREGHFALAKLLKEFGGWTDRDEEVCHRKDILENQGYFFFDEKSQDWHFREVRREYDLDSNESHISEILSIHETDDEDSLDDGDLSEGGECGLHNEDVQNSDDELANTMQEQDNNDENETSGTKADDIGLLMEQYLNDDCEYNWEDF